MLPGIKLFFPGAKNTIDVQILFWPQKEWHVVKGWRELSILPNQGSAL